MSTSKQKRLAREYAEKHGVKYTDALRAISEKPARIPLWDGEQAQGVLSYRLGVDPGTGEPYDLDLGGESPHVLLAGATNSGGERVWETIAAQVLTKPMPWDPNLFGGIVLIDPKGHNVRRWGERTGVKAINGLGALTGMTTFLLNSARSEKVVVIDPKTGEEMDANSGAKRMVKALDEVFAEVQRRADLLTKNRKGHWLDLPGAVLRREKLAPLIVILPSYAAHEETVLGSVQSRTARLAGIGRSVGVHLIVASHIVTSAVIPPALRDSLQTRIIVGRVPSLVDRIMFSGFLPELEETGQIGREQEKVLTRALARVLSDDADDGVLHRVEVPAVHEETLDQRLPRTNGHNGGNAANWSAYPMPQSDPSRPH